MSGRQGTDHFGEGKMELSMKEAKEQLQYNLRDQMGTLTFDVQRYDDDEDRHGEGIVIANINGGQVDHFIFHEKE